MSTLSSLPEVINIELQDYVPNPFHAGELRNKLCACMSGMKIKKCHGQGSHIHKDALKKLMYNLELNARKELEAEEQAIIAQVEAEAGVQ